MARRIQYYDVDLDITGNPYDQEDASEIRVWEVGGGLVACLSPDDYGAWSHIDGTVIGDGSREAAILHALELAEVT